MTTNDVNSLILTLILATILLGVVFRVVLPVLNTALTLWLEDVILRRRDVYERQKPEYVRQLENVAAKNAVIIAKNDEGVGNTTDDIIASALPIMRTLMKSENLKYNEEICRVKIHLYLAQGNVKQEQSE